MNRRGWYGHAPARGLVWDAMCLGWALKALFDTVHQDLRGLESYVTLVRATWVSSRLTLPLALGLLAMLVWILRRMLARADALDGGDS